MFSAAYSESEPSIPAADPHFVVTRRTSVSAECDSGESSDLSVSNNKPVSEAALAALSKIFLFQGLSADSLLQVARALVPRTAVPGQKIIVEGDEGDYFYVLESGTVHYEIGGKTVGHGGPGSSFGELALLYNSPRAATTIADEKCSLWALGRSAFKAIMIKARSEKREHSLKVLESIEILKGLNESSKLRLADALHPQQFSAGQEVVHQGDSGSLFYMIDEGEAKITRDGETVAEISRGGYFGELALLDNVPRAATVTAVTDLKLECLNKEGFERLLGPDIVAELRRRDPRKLSN